MEALYIFTVLVPAFCICLFACVHVSSIFSIHIVKYGVVLHYYVRVICLFSFHACTYILHSSNGENCLFSSLYNLEQTRIWTSTTYFCRPLTMPSSFITCNAQWMHVFTGYITVVFRTFSDFFPGRDREWWHQIGHHVQTLHCYRHLSGLKELILKAVLNVIALTCAEINRKENNRNIRKCVHGGERFKVWVPHRGFLLVKYIVQEMGKDLNYGFLNVGFLGWKYKEQEVGKV